MGMRRGMEKLPKDPTMLLSYINTQLRDHYPNLEELCDALSIDRAGLEQILGECDYEYDEEKNRFW